MNARKAVKKLGLLAVAWLAMALSGIIAGPLKMEYLIHWTRVAQHKDGICACTSRRCAYAEYLPGSGAAKS